MWITDRETCLIRVEVKPFKQLALTSTLSDVPSTRGIRFQVLESLTQSHGASGREKEESLICLAKAGQSREENMPLKTRLAVSLKTH